MNKQFFQILIIFVTWSFCNHVWAWSANEHRLVAQIAYNHLTPKTKHRVTTYLKHLHQFDSRVVDMPSASVLMDKIKMQDIDLFNHWHYINIPYLKDDIKAPWLEKHNVVWAINHINDILKTKNAPENYKALFFAFLVHLVGDVHQPMHCISLYNSRFPHGDRGGTLYQLAGSHSNLHRLWDDAFGLAIKRREVKRVAQALDKSIPRKILIEALKQDKPYRWAQESFKIGKDFAYQTPLYKRPSIRYRKQGEQITRQRMVIAGYRLAQLLNHILDSKGVQFHETTTRDGVR